MATEARYVRNYQDGIDTIHRNPREQCNLDDTTTDHDVGEDEALAAIDAGDAKPCRHCFEFDQLGPAPDEIRRRIGAPAEE